ncbi:DUF302 domain-containing protein [Pseudophaeobacter leonis]|uniref:DUF302 domain-containing protein n=1 Tax=Pseudophaeobacter leonis TaxID=1144477 RepID=UPI0009F704DD|nr:DUF302 domain-containing protein [Pseudophaeobacter leonis]
MPALSLPAPAHISAQIPRNTAHLLRGLVVTLAVFLAVLLAIILTRPAWAAGLDKRIGWEVHQTDKSYAALLRDVLAAVKAEGLSVVTQAGPTRGAAARGITIPGNRVIGVFNNDYALRVLALSTAAMIEAPIRLYVTEGGDGTASLSYKKPSHVFTPYLNEGGTQLMQIAAELDQRFAAIARAARD